jgi:rhodanese-related sulfurtransferase
MKTLKMLGLSSLLATGCQEAAVTPEAALDSAVQQITAEFSNVPQISTTELSAWLADPSREPPILLDVREPEEFAVSHLPGAIRIEPDATPEQVLEHMSPSRPLVLYCSIGYRSSELAESLIAAGAEYVINLEGSIFKWANEGRPLIHDGQGTDKVHPYNRRFGRMLHAPLRAESLPPK